MNNSEIIAALSIALTAIIFLLQSDDGLLKVKFKSVEKWYIIVAVLWIVLLCNHQIFDRYKLHIYSKPYGIFLTPNENKKTNRKEASCRDAVVGKEDALL